VAGSIAAIGSLSGLSMDRSRLVRGLAEVCSTVDPTPRLAGRLLRGQPPPPVSAISVYRNRNEATVGALIEPLLAAGASVRLWALDRPAVGLAEHTVGHGPGRRFQLLNRLLDGVAGRPLVVFDDDVRFRRGNLVDLVSLAAALGLDIAQPAHERASDASHPITRRRPFAVARLTNFVEIGPVVCFSAGVLSRVAPFPEAAMGWGTELVWADLVEEGFRLGIVDAVSLVHLGRLHEGYDTREDQERLSAALAERGLASLEEHTRTYRRIRLGELRARRRRARSGCGTDSS
jgi:hypothetical protein